MFVNIERVSSDECVCWLRVTGRGNPLRRGRYAMWQTNRAKFRGCFPYAVRKWKWET